MFQAFQPTNRVFLSLVFFFLHPSLPPPCSNTSASLLHCLHSLNLFVTIFGFFYLSAISNTNPRRGSRSWPSRSTSWGPTPPFSPRSTWTPARMQPVLPTPPSVGTTWRVQEAEEARPTVTLPLTAQEATSGRTIKLYQG